MPATKFTITGAAGQVAGAFQTITVTADDAGYVGDHSLVFSGANDPVFGNPGHPQTTNKTASQVAFGGPCVLTFVAGVATTDLTLELVEVALIACTDGSISAAGADRLSVTVTAGPATYFDWSFDGTPQVAGVGFTIPVINAVDPWGNIDLTYAGAKNLTFAGIGLAPDTTPPTISNNAGVAKNFGQVTAITFIAGVAVTGVNQLKALFYRAGLAQIMTFDDGTVTSLSNETVGFLVPKTIDVVAAALDHFAFVITTGQRSTAPFTGTNTLTAQDTYDNPKLTFDASADNVVVSPDAPFAGVITGLGSGVDDTLDQAGDFVNGVANLTGSIIYTGPGNTSTFTATSTVGAKTGTSNAFGLSSKFVVTGGAAEVAGVVNPITITADNVSYVGDHSIVFSGAAIPPLTAGPQTLNKNSVGVAFGLSCVLTFVAGVATTDMTLTKAETVDIVATDGVLTTAGADRLNCVVTADVAALFDYNTDNGATVVAGVQFQILEIRAIDGFGNIDLTYDFPGGKNLTFSGVGNAPDGTVPTVTNQAAAPTNFGAATSIVFNTGQAVTDASQLKVKLYKAALAQLIQVTDGALTSALAEGGGFMAPKAVDVLADALDHFVFSLTSGQRYGIPFVGTNTLIAEDTYDNHKLTFDASANTVTVTANAPLAGVVSGLGSGLNAVLNQAADFVLGVANLTGLLTFTGAGSAGTFTATSTVGAKTGTSAAVGFNLANQAMPILIENAMALSYQNSGAAPNNLAIYPRRILWDNPGAAGHNVIIEDGNGKILFQAHAKAQYDFQYAKLNENAKGGVKWKDFIVTHIDSGQLFIWYTT